MSETESRLQQKIASTINELQTLLRHIRDDAELRFMEISRGDSEPPNYQVVQGSGQIHVVPFLIVDIAVASQRVAHIAAYISEGVDADWEGAQWLERQPAQILGQPGGASGGAEDPHDHARERQAMAQQAMTPPPEVPPPDPEAQELPGDHPDLHDNKAAFDQGGEHAEIHRPRMPPMTLNDMEAKFWLAGYDHRRRGGERCDAMFRKYYPKGRTEAVTDDGPPA